MNLWFFHISESKETNIFPSFFLLICFALIFISPCICSLLFFSLLLSLVLFLILIHPQSFVMVVVLETCSSSDESETFVLQHGCRFASGALTSLKFLCVVRRARFRVGVKFTTAASQVSTLNTHTHTHTHSSSLSFCSL